MPSEAFINPRMLAWARLRSELSTEQLAHKIKPIKPARLSAWEDVHGEDRPTFKQATHLAKVLHVPFGYLFLTDPPDEDLPLLDLRTRQDPAFLHPSPNFLEVAYDALRKQEWYRGYLLEQDASEIPFIGRFDESEDVNVVAEDIRQTLGIDDDLRSDARDNDEYFRLLVRRCESVGIVVLRNSVVGNNTHRSLNPDEFQGFAEADTLAPVVFVNQNDYLAAQIFTLMHEIAHLWIGVSGVSVADYLNRPEAADAVHQKKADQIAAEVLVPAQEFSAQWDQGPDNSIRPDRLRQHYKVSVFVLLRRAYDLEKITRDEFLAEYDHRRAQIKRKSGRGGGGHRTIIARNSVAVTTAVLHSVLSGSLAPIEGAILLNVRPATLYNIAYNMAG